MRHHNHQQPYARPDSKMSPERRRRDSRKYGHPGDYHGKPVADTVYRQVVQRVTNAKRRRRDREASA